MTYAPIHGPAATWADAWQRYIIEGQTKDVTGDLLPHDWPLSRKERETAFHLIQTAVNGQIHNAAQVNPSARKLLCEEGEDPDIQWNYPTIDVIDRIEGMFQREDRRRFHFRAGQLRGVFLPRNHQRLHVWLGDQRRPRGVECSVFGLEAAITRIAEAR